MVTKMGEEEIKAIDGVDIGVRMEGQKADRDYLRTHADILYGRSRGFYDTVGHP